MFGLGPLELIVVLVVVLIFFGVGRLPELGAGMGEAIKNFKKGLRDANALDVTGSEKERIDKVEGREKLEGENKKKES